MATSGAGVGQQAAVEQCINLTTNPTGTWTYAVGTGAANNALSLNGNYRFSDQLNCTGASVGGPYGTIDTFPGSLTGLTHPAEALSVEITIVLTEGFDGQAAACVDDVSFVDSGGSATAVNLTHFGVERATATLWLWLIPAILGLLAAGGFLLAKRYANFSRMD